MAQVLRYEPGELYGRHHDAMDGQGRDPAGPRLFTVLLYLSEVNAPATPLPIHTPTPTPFRHPPRPAARPKAPPVTRARLAQVEGGGGTRFTDLNPPLTVSPRKGRALLWPSVLDEGDHTARDLRTHHEALAVDAGTKYAANAWVHLREFARPNLWGCTGAFATG